MKNILSFLVLAFLFQSCGYYNPPQKGESQAVKVSQETENSDFPFSTIKLPKGFKIELFAKDVVNARSMDLSPNGTLFVGTRDEGNVYALRDTNGDNKADEKYTLLTEGNMPNGVAFKDGDLYIAEVNRILKLENMYLIVIDVGMNCLQYRYLEGKAIMTLSVPLNKHTLIYHKKNPTY